MISASRYLDFCSQLFNALVALLVRPENYEKLVSHCAKQSGNEYSYEILHWTPQIIMLCEVFLQRGYLFL